MKKILPFLVAAVFWFLPFVGQAQVAEEIRSFHADVTVREDGLIDVVESIEYFFPTERHGIYRDIPTRYADESGQDYFVPLSNIGVRKSDGSSWPFKLERSRNAVRIKVGDPNATISGAQNYVISYTATGALRYFDDHDELYWNVTGTEWTVPIRNASAAINLPASVPTERINLKCYTGAAGSTSEQCLFNVQGNRADFVANDNLTVVVGWPPGLVAKVSGSGVGLIWYYWPLLIPVAVFALMFGRWWKHGRDADAATLMVQYDAPNGLRPAEVGTLIDQKADMQDVSATIVDLAVRGHLKISEKETKALFIKSKDYEFELLSGSQDPTSKFEQDVLTMVFSKGSKATLASIKASHPGDKFLPAIKKELYDKLTAEGYFLKNPQSVRGIYVAIGFIGAWAVIFFGGMLGLVDGLMVFSVILSGLIVIAFGWFMPRRTDKGSLAYEHARGFAEYIEKAEKYRSQWHERENIFEQFLPYAMVFGTVDKWSKAFAGMNLRQPNWYQSSTPGTFNAIAFGGFLGSLNKGMGSAFGSRQAKTSGGSGFSGGSSGGGFGGGGSGSW